MKIFIDKRKSYDIFTLSTTRRLKLSVANNILNQLGGNKFVAMTGAKDFICGNDYVTFNIPKANKGINRVKITLNNDLYTVEFMKKPRFSMKAFELTGELPKVTIISSFSSIYVDQLQELFTSETGLYTSL